MGLGNREKGKYITIYNGKFAMKVQEGTVGSISRVNKVGNIVHEIFNDFCTGKLIDIRIKESQQYGKTWEFVLLDVPTGDEYILQLSYSNSYATAFLKMLPNINLDEEFTLTPSQKIVEGKTQSSLFINQNKQSIKHRYTKDSPELPPMKKIIVKGKETWDDSDRLAFLTEMVNKEILPKLGKGAIVPEKTFDEKVADLDKEEESPF